MTNTDVYQFIEIRKLMVVSPAEKKACHENPLCRPLQKRTCPYIWQVSQFTGANQDKQGAQVSELV